MTHTPHEIAEEFPEHAERIHELKLSDEHFASLCETHHRLAREIHRGDTNIEPMDDAHLEELKKQRLAVLDEIMGYLN